MASLASISSQPAAPAPSKQASEGPARSDSTADDGGRALAPNAIFAALFGELTNAGGDEETGDSGKPEVPESVSGIASAPIATPVPQPWRQLATSKQNLELASSASLPADDATGSPTNRQPAAIRRHPKAELRTVLPGGGVPGLPPAAGSDAAPIAIDRGSGGNSLQKEQVLPRADSQLPDALAAPAITSERPLVSKTRAPQVETDKHDSKATEDAKPDVAVPTGANPAVMIVPVPVAGPSPQPKAAAQKKDEGEKGPGSVTEATLPAAIRSPQLPQPGHSLPPLANPPATRRSTPPADTAAKPILWPLAEEEAGTRRLAASRAAAAETDALPERQAVRLVAAGVREKGELAFTARLTPAIAESPARQTSRSPGDRREIDEPVDVKSATTDTTASAPRPVTRPSATQDRDEAPGQPPDRQPAAAVPQGPGAHVVVAASEGSSVGSGHHATAETPQTDPRPVLDSEPAPAKPLSPAKEIRLELSGGGERVELKLSEKAGELKVAVRTADNHLAERLRADLPALSSRLEQSGLRAETWHPSQAATGEWRRTDQMAAANQGGPQDDQSRQQGREQQHEGEPRRPYVPKDDQQPKDKRKDFEWFLSTTQ